ncbi:MAG: rhodanese-related sulfurtransferase [Parvibaculaceae bacterium]|jgi:rhodanese-related sulfurtransferase
MAQEKSQAPAAGAGFAGDVSIQEAWQVLTEETTACLIDVRSEAEWTFVGIPDLSSLKKTLVKIQWQSFPGMAVNGQFAEALDEYLAGEGCPKEAKILFLCRSGVRSRAAAQALATKGYNACFNIAGGFEGDLDEGGHRGLKNGWKVSGLPWIQS